MVGLTLSFWGVLKPLRNFLLQKWNVYFHGRPGVRRDGLTSWLWMDIHNYPSFLSAALSSRCQGSSPASEQFWALHQSGLDFIICCEQIISCETSASQIILFNIAVRRNQDLFVCLSCCGHDESWGLFCSTLLGLFDNMHFRRNFFANLLSTVYFSLVSEHQGVL